VAAFDYFISHSSRNKEIAERFYYLLVSNGLRPWYDIAFLEAGHDLHQQLKRGLDSSGAYLLFATREALSSPFVQMEMGWARARGESEPDFRSIVVKLDDCELDAWWSSRKYENWDPNLDEGAQLVPLLAHLAGIDTVAWTSTASFLSANPSSVLVNESRTLAEHNRNFALYYLAAIGGLLSAPHPATESSDTMAKVSALELFKHLPKLSGAVVPIEPGIYEFIHAVRMRVAPRVTAIGLPDQYVIQSEGNEVSTVVRVLYANNCELVRHPVPLSLEFDAELK